MTLQPAERRFVMEPRLDAEVTTINAAISAEATARANADNLKVAKAGDTMTGALTLPADPTLALEAATKQYVDNSVATGTTSGSRTLNVKNGASSLAKGQPVYISGADGTNIIISAAGNGSEATSSKTIGLVTTALSANAMGVVITNGLLSGLDTSGAGAAGDPVWLGPSGTLLYGLAAKPVAPAHLVYIGVVTKKNASTGEILVNPQNGFELDELHNVLITSPTNGQSLTYDNATGLWKNSTPASSLDSLTDVTINSGTLSGGQVIKYDAGTTQWVNGAAAGGVTAAATAPNLATSAAGDAWFDTNDGTLYVCYVDTDSTKQWVQVQANSALEASILSRLGALESTSVAFGALSPNYIINGAFEVNQRGFTSTTSSGFTFDRWSVASSSGTVTYSNQTFSPGASPSSTVAGKNYLRCVTSGQSGTSAYAIFAQAIEGVETLAGETVTVSFWAKAASGTPKIALEMYRSYGAGGSPSADEQFYAGQATLSTSMQRYSITYTLPSISGKTLGTTHTGYLKPQFWVSAGTDFNARTGSLGIQSNTFDIWGVQVERGTTATAFRRNAPSIQAELAACQRYYQRVVAEGNYGQLAVGWGYTSTQATVWQQFKVTMRTRPTSIEYSGVGIHDNYSSVPAVTSLTIEPLLMNSNVGNVTVLSSGLSISRPYWVGGSNNAAAYLAFNAEL